MISKSPQVRFLLVWSSLIYFPVHQLAATNCMHLQSNYTTYLQHIQSEAHLESSRIFAVELSCGNSQHIKPVGYFCRRAPLWISARILNATVSNNFLHLYQALATFPKMFGNIPWNVWGHSLEFLATYPGMFGGILWNVWRDFLECLTTFPRMFDNIPRNVWGHYSKCLATFPGI